MLIGYYKTTIFARMFYTSLLTPTPNKERLFIPGLERQGLSSRNFCNPLGISHDGNHTLWRRALQHDGALWDCSLRRGHNFPEQRVQIPVRRMQLEGLGLETCIIEQVPNDALLKTGTLSGRGQGILEPLKLLAHSRVLLCELAFEGGQTALGDLEITFDGGQRRLQFMAGQVEEVIDEQTQF